MNDFIIIEKPQEHICPFCGREVNVDEFKDELSVKEFIISGLCQRCQDEVFGNSPCTNCNEENCINCDSP